MDTAFYMQRALALAEQGRGKTRTNPLVGAVIVRDDRIIGEGYHHYYGGDHAEIDAIKNAVESVTEATIYVSLEPCSHLGKTPPCAKALIEAGFGKVVAAMVDPNPKVSGQGIRMLRNAGIEVETGVCETEARKLNEAYIKYITTGLPFVIVKIAQTIDGRIADSTGYSKWITSDDSRTRVHELRSEVGAVLIGGNTVRLDDPRLTSHGVSDRNPLRVVLSRRGNLSSALRLFADNEDKLTVLATANGDASLPVQVWALSPNGDGNIDPAKVLKRLGQEKICSLLVEGGSQVFSDFISRGLVDKYIFVVAPRLLGGGTYAFAEKVERSLKESINLVTDRVTQIGGDVWVEAYPT